MPTTMMTNRKAHAAQLGRLTVAEPPALPPVGPPMHRCNTHELDALETGCYDETIGEHTQLSPVVESVYDFAKELRKAALALANDATSYMENESYLPTSRPGRAHR